MYNLRIKLGKKVYWFCNLDSSFIVDNLCGTMGSMRYSFNYRSDQNQDYKKLTMKQRRCCHQYICIKFYSSPLMF